MKLKILNLSLLVVLFASNVQAAGKVSDEASLIDAFAMASVDSSINKIEFKKNALIILSAPVIYTGTQSLLLNGNGVIIDGSAAGSFDLDSDLIATTTDATLVFNTAANITIKKLTVVDSATRGIVVNIPATAQGDDIQVTLHKVNIVGSALYGLHIDDNKHEFDEGTEGSALGIELNITQSSFIDNGIGAIDFDGIRVDERAHGDIHAMISDTHIDANGGDGIELDEAGDGNVDATMRHVTLNGNGFYNEDDLDDGFDIDEAGSGDIDVTLFEVEAIYNRDEGLDFDEEDDGNVKVKLRRVTVIDTTDEGIKLDEEGAGNIKARFFKVEVKTSGDDGIQITELGEGRIDAELEKVTVVDNEKYGIQIEQWGIECEEPSLGTAGALKVKAVTLRGNTKGDEMKLHNVLLNGHK